MEEVQSLADDIGVIYNGKLIFNGTKSDFESLSDLASYDDTLINLIDNSWILFYQSSKKSLLMF